MFYFYILRSKKDRNLYFGYSHDLRKRIKEHNRGRVLSTKNRRSLELVYYEGYNSERDARNREIQIKKRTQALTTLRQRIKNSLSE